ncbi:TPA: MFS transporter [Stenotrophomonas maltophilia]|nr:MFS transporter [Stenotrophomonas maltophilia]
MKEPSVALQQESLAAPRKGAWWVLGILCFVYVLNFLDRQLLSILAKPIQDELGVSDGQLGLIGGLYFALFYCILAIPVGWLADRTNRVKVLAFSCGLWSAATAACGMASSYPQLVVARMIWWVWARPAACPLRTRSSPTTSRHTCAAGHWGCSIWGLRSGSRWVWRWEPGSLPLTTGGWRSSCWAWWGWSRPCSCM